MELKEYQTITSSRVVDFDDIKRLSEIVEGTKPPWKQYEGKVGLVKSDLLPGGHAFISPHIYPDNLKALLKNAQIGIAIVSEALYSAAVDNNIYSEELAAMVWHFAQLRKGEDSAG